MAVCRTSKSLCLLPKRFELQYVELFLILTRPHNTLRNSFLNLNMSTAHDGVDIELSPHSCGNCRRGKRKCNRVLPACGECTSKNKTCIYVQPAKRGPKRKKKVDPYPVYQITVPPENSLEAELAECRDLMNICHTVLLPHTKLKQTCEYIKALHVQSALPGVPPTKEELAYTYAMLAYALQGMGKITVSKFFLSRALEALGTKGCEPVVDYNIALAFLFLGITYVSNNDRDRAKYYLDEVGAFLQRVSQQVPHFNDETYTSQELLYYRGLENRYHWTLMQLHEREDVEIQLKGFLRVDYLTRNMKRLQDSNVQEYNDQIENYLRDIRVDIRNGTNQHPLRLELFNNILNDLRRQHEERCRESIDARSRGNLLLLEMVTNAFRIKYLKRSGNQYWQTIRDAADQIANTSVVQSRTYSNAMSAGPVIEAASIHLQSYTVGSEESETNALIGRLSDELKSLHLSGGKHKRIADRFQDMIHKMERVVQNYEENFALRSLPPKLAFDPRAISYNFGNTIQNFNNAVVLRDSPVNALPDLNVGDLILERVEDVELFMHEFFGDKETLILEEETDIVIQK
jgi:hypothetical protein